MFFPFRFGTLIAMQAYNYHYELMMIMYPTECRNTEIDLTAQFDFNLPDRPLEYKWFLQHDR